MPGRLKSAQKTRLEIAEMAARLIAIDGAVDYHAAKRKAASQLGLSQNKNLPTNQEIQQALINYQQLFQSNTQGMNLVALRLQAVEAMKVLHQFNPVLVGPVAAGTATKTSEITLHLYFDQVEQVGLFLNERGIPNKLCEKHIRINATRSMIYPAYRFIADQTPVMLVIFSEKDKNLSPRSSIDNKTMKMIAIKELMSLVEENKDLLHK
ncbi:MAG: hypothetical protein ACI9SC_000652 [Gammaproteobacteria bacterium]|jgi:hypothetical protein